MSNLLKDNKKLLNEWCFEKNKDIDINKITLGSNKKVWWICSKGHEWQALISSRTLSNAGCPYCSNRKTLSGFNDLVTLNYNLSLEWNYKKNQINPKCISPNSHEHVWWKCSNCGYEWNAEIKSRNQGAGCPECSKKKFIKTRINNSICNNGSLSSNYPNISNQWNYS